MSDEVRHNAGGSLGEKLAVNGTAEKRETSGSEV